MTDDPKKNKMVRIEQENPGFFTGMSRTIRLVLRLIADKRVNFLLKLLPISTLVYLVSPLDAAIPAVDDALIVGFGTYFFVELCPPEIVEEHRAQLAGLDEPEQAGGESGQIVD
jgi:hypothetical protein